MEKVDSDIFQIDEYNLDKEWSKQAPTYWEYAEKLADAKMMLERAKAERDVANAELDRDIRSNPENYGISKITETVVLNTIIVSKKYQRVVNQVIEKKHDVDILQAVVDTLDHKKKAIEGRVHLWTMSYCAEPKASKESKDHTDEVEKKNIRHRVRITRGNPSESKDD